MIQTPRVHAPMNSVCLKSEVTSQHNTAAQCNQFSQVPGYPTRFKLNWLRTKPVEQQRSWNSHGKLGILAVPVKILKCSLNSGNAMPALREKSLRVRTTDTQKLGLFHAVLLREAGDSGASGAKNMAFDSHTFFKTCGLDFLSLRICS